MIRTARSFLVFVYRNRHLGGFSIRDESTKTVIAHADSVLVEDAVFRVSQAGRLRVKSTGRRNVHAGVRGRLVVCQKRAAELLKSRRFRVDYNPCRDKNFVDGKGREVFRSPSVLLEHGAAWCEDS